VQRGVIRQLTRDTCPPGDARHGSHNLGSRLSAAKRPAVPVCARMAGDPCCAMTLAVAARRTGQGPFAGMAAGKGCLMEIINLGRADGLPPVDWAAVAVKLDAGSAPAPDALNSRTTWLSTVNEDGSPHVTAVGALWLDGAFWFQTGAGTRKGHHCPVQRAVARATAVERVPHRAALGGRDPGDGAGWPDPLPVLTLRTGWPPLSAAIRALDCRRPAGGHAAHVTRRRTRNASSAPLREFWHGTGQQPRVLAPHRVTRPPRELSRLRRGRG
jgi:Pyridoxamine 5'-phosphate oxidase